MAALTGDSTGTTASSASKTDFDVCFPTFARVTLANGREKAISDVKPAAKVAGYSALTGELETAVVQSVQVHDRQPYQVITVVLTTTQLYASLDAGPVSGGFILQATPNYPIWTTSGPIPLRQLKAGQTVKCLDMGSGTFTTYQVAAVNPGPNGTFHADKVYNLVTDKTNYVVNRTVVMGK